jgi:putative aminopeptidase FrvX
MRSKCGSSSGKQLADGVRPVSEEQLRRFTTVQLGLLRDDIAGLTQLFGPSGHEDLVIAEFAARVRSEGFSPAIDRLGNVVVHARPAQPGWPTVAVAAHLDEVGVVVSDVGGGWVRVSGVGGIHATVMPGQVLQFRSDTGDLIEGCVSVDSAHLSKPDDQRAARIEDVCVDLLMTSAAEAKQCGIAPGTPGVFAGPFAQRGDRVRAKALDDRAGLAVLLALLRSASSLPDGPGLTIIATVQEEFTIRAGFVAAAAAAPDILLCIDISPARSVADEQATPVLGAGPVLHRYSRGRSGGGLIPNPRLTAYVAHVAATRGIPLAQRALDGGLTDASYMQFAAAGIPCVDLCFAVRNAHTAVEVAHLSDLGLLADLVRNVVADLPADPGLRRG